jgi:hypothetical protein
LERSTDRSTFERIYGTEASQNLYTHTDNQLSAEIYFYRIKRIYKDGNYDYSNTVEIYHAINEQITVYPNPSYDMLWIRYKTKEHKEIILTLTNMTGQVVKRIQKSLMAGIQEWNVNMSDLPAGMYMLHTPDGIPIKVVKE